MCRPDIRQLATHFVISGLLLAALALPGTARAATVGTLTQLAAPSGCITDASFPIPGCASGNALQGIAPFFGSHAVALSPDGQNLYAAAFNSDSIAVFDRNAKTGKLSQKSGTAACISNTPLPGCATGRGLLKPTSVVVSEDGKNVYSAAIVGSAISTFDRSSKTGALTQKSGTAGCISNTADRGCALGRALEGADVVAISPDGHNVYSGSFVSNAVTIFDRNRSTGSLQQKPGPPGCITEAATTGCETGRMLGGAEGLTVSPDGKSVYVGAAIGNGVAVFRRNRSTGGLIQPQGTAGCSAFMANEGCANGDGVVGADAMEVSSDNKNLYVAAGVGSSVAIYKRSTKSGNISQIPGIAGCFTDRKRDLGRCTTGVELDGPEGVAVSPDGKTVYVGSFFSSSVTVFDRTKFNGTIIQRAGANGCIVNVATSGCTTGNALDSANAIAISRDSRSVYVGAYGSNAVVSFSRAAPAAGHVSVSVPARLQVPSGHTAFVPVTCRGTTGRWCPGGITISALAAVPGTVGRGSFSAQTGDRDQVTVVLSSAARRYLRTHSSLAATARLRVVQPTGQIRVVSQPITLLVSGLG